MLRVDLGENGGTMNEPLIARATEEDAAAILALLERAHLPTAGLVDHLEHSFVAHRGSDVVGAAAIELYEGGALLRSVVVDETERGSGVGTRLSTHALEEARKLRLPAVFLLTTTAEGFFPRFGFERIDRSEVPATVRQSIEFTSACPASAVVMRKLL